MRLSQEMSDTAPKMSEIQPLAITMLFVVIPCGFLGLIQHQGGGLRLVAWLSIVQFHSENAGKGTINA